MYCWPGRRSYIRTLASRDLREFGLTLPAASIERFLAHVAQDQANLWNADSTARVLGIGESTAIGASWEPLAVDEVLRRADDAEPYFWRTSKGAEVDLVLERFCARTGFEMKRTDAPKLTSSMASALDDSALALDHLWVLYPGARRYALNERATALPLRDLLGVTSIDEL